MMEKFWETPDSTMPGFQHPCGVGVVVPLESEEKNRMGQFIPGCEELNVYGGLFLTISDTELRNAAHHLLWFGRELNFGREPLTKDKL
jgi:hypothetical protein